MGRIVTFLLVLIVVALGARVLFTDAPGDPDVSGSQAGSLRTPAPPVVEPLAPAATEKSFTVVDPDPDLDQSTEPADCPGTPEQPVETKPDSPAPH